MAPTTSAPVAFDPYDYRFQADPYPTYAWLRDEAPLYHDADQGFWALSRHADVKAALQDTGTFSNSHGVSIDPAAWGDDAARTMSFLAMDPPEQTRLRSLVASAFTPRRVRGLEERVRALARRHLEEALADGPAFDLIGDFAGRLPMDVVSELVGVPESDRTQVRELADLVVHREEGRRDVPERGMQAAGELIGYYEDLVADRRDQPRDDLTSALVQAEVDGDRLDDDEIVAFLFLMVVAGNETTANLLGHAVWWGVHNPGQLATVRGDHGRIGDWVEETLRYDASSQMIARYVTADVELHGRVVPAGSQMILLLGSANRDPRVFPEPDAYDLDRDTSALLSFGFGRHFCLGAHLARLEARVALEELLGRTDGIDVDRDGARRLHSVNVRGFSALPVRVEPR